MASTSIRTTLGGTQGSAATGLAGTGTTLSGATAITAGMVIATAATSNTAYTLPASATAGTSVTFLNAVGTAVTALVFPATSAGKVNNGSAGASVSVAQNKAAIFVNLDGADNWASVILG